MHDSTSTDTDSRILIKKLYFAKGCGTLRLINESLAKEWKRNTLNNLLMFETIRKNNAKTW